MKWQEKLQSVNDFMLGFCFGALVCCGIASVGFLLMIIYAFVNEVIL